MAIQDNDLFVVHRFGKDQQVRARDTQKKILDDDVLLIHRNGVDYQVSGKDLMEYRPKLPWGEDS